MLLLLLPAVSFANTIKLVPYFCLAIFILYTPVLLALPLPITFDPDLIYTVELGSALPAAIVVRVVILFTVGAFGAVLSITLL